MSAGAGRRVAVVIPVFRATFLQEALESVVRQSRGPDEMIVIDDGSPDRAELTRAVESYPGEIRLLRQSNAGAAAARNAGVSATDAELIAFLDADDCWLPAFLERQLLHLERRPEVDLVYTDARFIGSGPLVGRNFMSVCRSEGPVTVEALLALRCTIPLSTVVVRRQAIVDAGLFDVSLRRGQDFDLWVRMAGRGARMAYQREVLTLRRIHTDNLSGTQITEIERALTVFRKALATMSLSRREQQVARRRLRQLEADLARERGKEMLRRGEFAAARRCFAEVRMRRGWKLRAAQFGLRFAPRIVRRLYLSRLDSI